RALHFPVEELWSFVHEEEREFSVSELTELYFGDNSLENHLTLRLALYEDPIFFKRKKFSFTPRPVSTVEELKKAEETRKEKEQLLELALQETLQAKEGKRDLSSFSPSTKLLLHTLERIAAQAPHIDNHETRDVNNFLEHFEAKSNKQLAGAREEKCYQFLRSIGWFHKNTNLSFIRHALPREFSTELLQEAEKLRETAQGDREGRRDLTALQTFTIDDVDTEDMDDALSFERIEGGGYRIGIHIADVSSVIPIDSKLDLEAKTRATSLYFPEKNVHMFPAAVAADLCSLRQGELRPTMSFFIEFSSLHEIQKSSLCVSTIRVAEKRSYDEVDQLLNPPTGEVGDLYQLAISYESTRMAAGGLKIPKREMRIRINDPEHLPESDFTIEPYSEQTPARELIGEMMVLANETAAKFARDNNIPFIYRSQEPSDKDAEKRLVGVPAGPAFDAALRGTLKRSVTSTEPAPHSTLGLECYAQVTSPIRRYADLVNQRQLAAFLRGDELPYSTEDIDQLLHETSEQLQRARLMNRETMRFWVLKYLKRKADKRESITGVIVRDDGPQYMVELDEVFIPALFKANEKLKRGDQVELTIQKADPRFDYLRLVLKK
ncbi:MAG: RNB domain-containing ribonuclease, partial [Bdellovibrionales bacterium]|nr:RNB domain-containing ribonuclease [Bdellovibrionales bacterium]